MEHIAFLGWMDEATAHAVCIEVEPGSKVTEDFNRKLVADAEEDMAPVEPDSIKYGSLACRHTNQGLRAIGAGCQCSNTTFADGHHYCVG